MSSKHFYELCKKEIKKDEIMVWSIPRRHYCKNCWIDKKNWPSIHRGLTKRRKRGYNTSS